MQKKNYKYFEFEILCILTRIYFKNCCNKKLFTFVYVFVLFCVLPKSIKLPSDFTKLLNFVNKNYDYEKKSIIVINMVKFLY